MLLFAVHHQKTCVFSFQSDEWQTARVKWPFLCNGAKRESPGRNKEVWEAARDARRTAWCELCKELSSDSTVLHCEMRVWCLQGGEKKQAGGRRWVRLLVEKTPTLAANETSEDLAEHESSRDETWSRCHYTDKVWKQFLLLGNVPPHLTTDELSQPACHK